VPPSLRNRWAAALAAAAILDTLTFLLLPPGAEANPLAAMYPYIAIPAKAALAVALVLWPWRYRRAVQICGAVAWSIGATSNVLVLGGL